MDDRHRQDVLARLKSAEGHLRGIERMVSEDVYCIDIIKQIVAVQKALAKVNALMLENHLATCATTAIRSEDSEERERVIGEIVDVFQTANKV
jgi:DNA-binding FrmR family transcriptional regulator